MDDDLTRAVEALMAKIVAAAGQALRERDEAREALVQAWEDYDLLVEAHRATLTTMEDITAQVRAALAVCERQLRAVKDELEGDDDGQG